ncbi:hypothetical protein C2E19_12525 [Pseudomonas sp. DTU12.3]|nr:hypothetical protein C2E19_12525 [Pseudomonas sp. DTU12.3]
MHLWLTRASGSVLLWRGGLPPFGCAAVAKLQAGCVRHTGITGFGGAARPSGGKPPRHRVFRR